MADGEFVVLVDHDDRIEADALELVATAIDADPTIDYVYTDEDKLSPDGTRLRHVPQAGLVAGTVCARRTTAPTCPCLRRSVVVSGRRIPRRASTARRTTT